MAVLQRRWQNVWLLLLFLVLGSNIVLYHTQLGNSVLVGASNGVVIGSLIDLVIVAPLLFLSYKKQKSFKQLLFLMATGLIIARFVIPMNFLHPYVGITWVGFAVEAGLVLLEFILIVTLFMYLPKIMKATKESTLPTIFAFPAAVDHYVKKHPIIHIVCSEMLMFYYALMSWRKKINESEQTLTLHKKSSYIALQIMLIHAIVIETLGIHWWLHDKSTILSLVLLFLNVYSVIFLLADIQAVRLSPVYVDENKLYISLGLSKRMEIRWDEIEEVITDKELLKQKLSKDTIDFVAKDFEEVFPNVILKLKRPKEATLVMGIKKPYQKVAIKFDDYQAVGEMLKKYSK
ncbi:beta-carotene 15,15'-monooxygenase [Lysinibacillus sp. SGAir0095]|uniref:beta-carotene 15,15'-monooxygenase n=1 Tax=Lysinibacillus sp. SGAir0095 TaxID=2070463 RepID=UPI0010CD4358|nr:beta-carotene 15,15'-monooxygenase [Lysinibacillus sp. SGAir0095]QCR32875.1 beta-carotene 15,15'-monooxygenase [Lysinibacillus sp. SGAir0095]